MTTRLHPFSENSHLAQFIVMRDVVFPAKSKNLEWIIVVGMMILAWVLATWNVAWTFRYFPPSLVDLCFAAAISLFLLFLRQFRIYRAMLTHVGIVARFAVSLLRAASRIAARTQASSLGLWNVRHETVEHYATKGFGLCG